MNVRLALVFLCIFVTAGCDAVVGNGQHNVPTQISSSTPLALRMANQSDLSAVVTLNGGEKTTYYGSEQANGQWAIIVDLIPNQTNTIRIEWLENQLLLVEQQGEIFADPENPILELDLDFKTTGGMKYDIDCDGESNLAERYNNTDPLTSNTGETNLCEFELVAPEDVPEGQSLARIYKSYKPFTADNIFSPVTNFEQLMQVRNVDEDRNVQFTASISSDWLNDNRTSLSLVLQSHPSNGRRAVFRSNRAIDFITPRAEGSECTTEQNSNPADYSIVNCVVPFNWKERVWYKLSMTEVADDQWLAILTDTESLEEIPLGFITVFREADWFIPALGINYFPAIPNVECQTGIEPSHMHFRAAEVNSETKVSFRKVTVASDVCVAFGAGFNESEIRDGDEFLYSLTLGR